MEREAVLNGLADVAEELLGVTRDQVTEDARFDEDLDVDSLGLVEFVMAVEDKFDVKVPEERLEGITTIGQAADLVLEMAGTPAVTDGRPGDRRRVAVTGLGVKAPAGTDLESYWTTLREGRSSAGPITRFDATILPEPFRFSCEVPPFDMSPYLDFKEARHADRCTQLGLAAAMDALADAGGEALTAITDPARCGVYVGSGVGGLMTLEREDRNLFEKGSGRVSPYLVPMMMANATAGTVGLKLGWTGPNLCVTTASAAGTHGIGEGAMLIRYGAADVVLAGGTEACNTPLAMSAFGRMGALSSRVDDPTHASRPFDPDRDGFVMGEGAGFLLLEEWDHAVARGARIWGEILGYARNSDAFHITAPSPGGGGAAACMQQALADAGLEPGDIAHVNAHGTSTPLNDASEASALVKVFGERTVPVTSGKGVTGHLVAGAGAIEAVAVFLALQAGEVPPTANHDRDDPDLAIDVVSGEPRAVAPGPVVSNSFGFGGHNASVVLGPPAGHGVQATQAGHGVQATQAGHGVQATQAGHGVQATQAVTN